MSLNLGSFSSLLCLAAVELGLDYTQLYRVFCDDSLYMNINDDQMSTVHLSL